jgi:hypothetical protein
VLRERFLQDANQSCLTQEDRAAILAQGAIGSVSPTQARRNVARRRLDHTQLEKARSAAGAATFSELAERRPSLAPRVKDYEHWAAEQRAIAAIERRFICEGLMAAPAKTVGAKHEPGMQDEGFRDALRRFQQKHVIYEGPTLRPRTIAVLAQSTLENDYATLVRTLRERVAAAADVIEDGSTDTKHGSAMYIAASGEKVAIRNLVDEYSRLALEQWGLTTPERALEFFERHPAEDFEQLSAGVKLPPRPEYYSSDMDLSIVIDRGDVWYDPPFDDQDHWRSQPRSRFPSLTLYLDYRGQKLPLARWRTTIGGWRSEQAANGYEYYKYKGSDVGARVLRKVVAGPVWIAPESTPIRGLVKSKKISGQWDTIVNYDEIGPGYLSAYGLVAGYFVVPGDNDQPDVDLGIRAHGSSNYLSMYSSDGYSHGCHRLPNHLAIRLYDFLLQHRHVRIKGDAPSDFSRQFLANNQVYDIRIASRGFEFELDPPIAVNVLAGTIRGESREPIKGYVPKPGVRYPSAPPGEAGEGDPHADMAAP